MNAKLDYDVRSDAAYLRFSSNAVLESEEISPGVVMDFDVDGKIVAIEFLDAAARIPAEALMASPDTKKVSDRQVTSAAIRSVAYDPSARMLFVTFTDGDLYAYFDIAAEVYEDFRSASSKGRFFLEHVRSGAHAKVTDEAQFAAAAQRLSSANDSFEVGDDDGQSVSL